MNQFRPSGLRPQDCRILAAVFGLRRSWEVELLRSVPRAWSEIAYTLSLPISRFASAELADGVCARDREHGAADDPLGPVVETLKQSKTRAAAERGLPCFTSLDTFRVAVESLARGNDGFSVRR